MILYIFYNVQVGQVFPGTIKKTYPYGCFVQFPNSLTGLSPVRYLKDEFISDTAGAFKDMTTVLAKVRLRRTENGLTSVLWKILSIW